MTHNVNMINEVHCTVLIIVVALMGVEAGGVVVVLLRSVKVGGSCSRHTS